MSGPVEQAPHPPRLSFLVAAWNESQRLPLFVQSFLALRYPERELILCAGGTDGTLAYAQTLTDPRITVLVQAAGEGKQRALRKALREASGDIVVLTDADVVVSDAAVERLVAPIIHGAEAVTSGTNRPPQAQLSTSFVQYQYSLRTAGLLRSAHRQYLHSMNGSNCAVRREVLEEVGGFDEDVAIGTDSFLGKKLVQHGYRIRFVPDSIVETDYPVSFRHYCRQRARWRRNAILQNLQFRLYRRVLNAFVPSLIGLMMFLLPLTSLVLGRKMLYVWSALAGYAYLRRIEYMQALYRVHHLPSRPSIYLKVGFYMWVEWAAQVLAVGQLPSSHLRRLW